MINQLRSAGDQLRIALDNYLELYSGIKNGLDQGKRSLPNCFPPELTVQLETQLAFISSYEPKLHEAKLVINRVCNYSSGRAPINSLPSEILTRIFHFVGAQPCSLDQLSESSRQYFPRYPDCLAQVCALWRNTAIESCSLWCHIDLYPYEPFYDGLIARAETHVERAGELPIELHINGEPDDRLKRIRGSCPKIFDFLRDVSSRVATLELVVHSDFGFYGSLLGLLIPKVTVATKLVLRSRYPSLSCFIGAGSYGSSSRYSQGELLVDTTQEQMENGFTPLTVLHLNDIFPSWSSRAYHGLVDLRLLAISRSPHIDEAALVTILHSSPGLQILHFGLRIWDPTPEAEVVTPIKLQDLRVLKIFPFTDSGSVLCPGDLIRLIAPGSKLVRLSFEGYYPQGAASITELERFLERSRVERFYTKGVCPPIDVLLRSSADLQHVILDDIPVTELPARLEVDQLSSISHLESLHIIRSTLFERDLRFLLGCCPDGTVIQCCDINRDDSEQKLSASELANHFPSLKITEHSLYSLGNPTADWDVID